MSRRFMIGSLLAAGFGQTDALQASLARSASTTEPGNKNLFQIFRQDHLFTLAGHSSHSSHSSHASHASHSSGGGGYSGGHFSHASHYSSTGGYSPPSYNPEPVYSPPATSPPAAPSPEPSLDATPQPLLGNTPSSPSSGLKPLPGHSALFKTIVQRLQVALMGRGLFEGPINGAVGPNTRAAIRKFQEKQGLEVTGTITPETLDALHVPGG